jgi:hypothetical protein
MGVLAVGAGAIALIAVVGFALIALVVIVVGPSRRVRAEPPLDPEVEAALLLGEDPDEVALEASPDTGAYAADEQEGGDAAAEYWPADDEQA